MTDHQTGYQLAHPVYLDVAMMISFLAYLEGGVVTSEEATQKEAGTRKDFAEALVTRVIIGSNTINLTRRTIVGVANPEVAKNLVANVQTEDIKLDVADPIVTAPAVQILPMAIFI